MPVDRLVVVLHISGAEEERPIGDDRPADRTAKLVPSVNLLAVVRIALRQRVVAEQIEARSAQLIGARNAARKAKNFAEADRIRDVLSTMGIQLKDAKDPATGEIVTTWEVRASGATDVQR